MLAKSLQPADITALMEQPPQGSMADHPVIRTLYDHVDEITCVEFHPTEQVRPLNPPFYYMNCRYDGNFNFRLLCLVQEILQLKCLISQRVQQNELQKPSKRLTLSETLQSIQQVLATKKMFNHSILSLFMQQTHLGCGIITQTNMLHIGDYLLAATYHPVLRLYDLETFQCFVCNQPSDQHKRGVNCVCYSPTGNIYASGSKDGAIKVIRIQWCV